MCELGKKREMRRWGEKEVMGDNSQEGCQLAASLAIQCLRLCTSKAGVLGLSPGQRTKIPCAAQGNLKIQIN